MEGLERASGGCDVESFRRVVSLLRFFRRINRLGELDKFASAPDADAAVKILGDLMSWVSRNVVVRDGKRICFEEKIEERERAVFKYLCGERCIQGDTVVVPCPRLPTEAEVKRLYDCIREGKIKPELLRAIAHARAGP